MTREHSSGVDIPVNGWLFMPSVRTAIERSAPGETACWTLSVSSGSGKSLALSESNGAGQSDVPGNVDAQTPDERMIGHLRRSATMSPRLLSTTSDGLELSVTPLEDAVCGRLGCRETEGVAIVDPGDGYPRALCRRCRVAYLEVVA